MPMGTSPLSWNADLGLENVVDPFAKSPSHCDVRDARLIGPLHSADHGALLSGRKPSLGIIERLFDNTETVWRPVRTGCSGT